MNSHVFFDTIGEKLGARMGSPSEKKCPVCETQSLHKVRGIKSVRMAGEIWDSYFCVYCESVINDSGYYEDDDQLRADLDWNVSVVDRNRRYLRQLSKLLNDRNLRLDNVLEIGCGIGTGVDFFLKNAATSAIGFDANRIAIDFGRKHFGIDSLSSDFFTADVKLDNQVDFVFSNSVLEHIREPRPLMFEIAKFCRSQQATAFVSVPFFSPNDWDKYLYKGDVPERGNMLRAADVHVTYFSEKGFIKVMNDIGCTSYEPIIAGAWAGYLMSF